MTSPSAHLPQFPPDLPRWENHDFGALRDLDTGAVVRPNDSGYRLAVIEAALRELIERLGYHARPVEPHDQLDCPAHGGW